MRVFAFVRLFVFLLFSAICVGASGADALTKSAAVTLAEKFVAENGYTDLPGGEAKRKLDPESLERSDSREAVLAGRFNTLERSAIGIKGEARSKTDGWSVAFDYVGGGVSSSTCRVVTMDRDGTNIRMQHVDGLRPHFAGFD